MKATLSSISKKLQGMLQKLRKYNDKTEKKEQSLEQHVGKQQEILDLAYSRALRTISSKKKELSKALSITKFNTAINSLNSLETVNAQNLNKLSTIKEILSQPSGLSMEEYSTKVQQASDGIDEIEHATVTPLRVELCCFAENISITDRSEMIPMRTPGKTSKDGNSNSHIPRAQSTSNNNLNKHRKPEKPEPPAIPRKDIEKISLNRTNVMSHIVTHRNETISPKKEGELCCIISPTCSESTVASAGITLLSVKAGGTLDSSLEAETESGLNKSKGADAILNYKAKGKTLKKKTKDSKMPTTMATIGPCRVSYGAHANK